MSKRVNNFGVAYEIMRKNMKKMQNGFKGIKSRKRPYETE